MKSLFLRVFVSLWLTMTLILGVFAVVNALTFPSEFAVRHRRNSTRFMELRATQALDCQRERSAACAEGLAAIDDRDAELSIYQEGVLILGSPIAGAEELEALTRETGATSERAEDARDLLAIVLDRPGQGRFVVVSAQRRPSLLLMFLVPETLGWRLLAIVIVTGVVSVFLGRYLSQPIRALRAATHKLAEGDLSVRVAPQLEHADSETLALGREMDRMAGRIEALLEAQRRLLRDVSHELRSPLARLNIALELARRKSPVEAGSALDRIERESQRLDEMIGELLTLSRLEAGVGSEERASLDLSKLVESVAADVAFEAEQRGSKLELKVEPGIVFTGNEELLRRAVENILRNAARFTDAGATVEVGLRRSEATTELTVRDHGPGVPDALLEAIFQPFFRVASDRARASGGAGIGLAIAKRAADLHHGTLTAKNATDGGLLVTLRLPAPG